MGSRDAYARSGLCGTQTNDAKLMLGSGEAFPKYYILADGHRAALKRYWLCSVLGPPDLVRCWSELGLGFWRNFCISNGLTPSSKTTTIANKNVGNVGIPPEHELQTRRAS